MGRDTSEGGNKSSRIGQRGGERSTPRPEIRSLLFCQTIFMEIKCIVCGFYIPLSPTIAWPVISLFIKSFRGNRKISEMKNWFKVKNSTNCDVQCACGLLLQWSILLTQRKRSDCSWCCYFSHSKNQPSHLIKPFIRPNQFFSTWQTLLPHTKITTRQQIKGMGL